MTGVVIEKVTPVQSGEVKPMKSIFLNKVLEEQAPRSKGLLSVRVNDDIVLLFRHDPENTQHKYVTGKADGKTYVGIMPFKRIKEQFCEVKDHEEIVKMIQAQFSVTLTNVKGGWVMIEDTDVYIHGNSVNYPENDHETARKAIHLVPEMANFDISIG